VIVEQVFELLTRFAAFTQAGQRVHGSAPAARGHPVARALEHRVERRIVAQRAHAVERAGAYHVGPRRLIDHGFQRFEHARLARAPERASRLGGDQVAGFVAEQVLERFGGARLLESAERGRDGAPHLGLRGADGRKQRRQRVFRTQLAERACCFDAHHPGFAFAGQGFAQSFDRARVVFLR